jgi:hypothetical protein
MEKLFLFRASSLMQSKKVKRLLPLRKLNFSFWNLEHHKTLYLDLHRGFTMSEYAPQSEASLQNFRTLLMLEISVLLGADIEWAMGSSLAGGAAVAGPPVLAAGAAADDDDASISGESDAPGRAIRDAAAPAPAPANPNAGDDTNDACGGADAAAEDGDRIVLDVGDFTSWEPDTWEYADYDKIQFPTDPMLSICSVRPYFAVAMILWHQPALREKHTRTWDGLTAAWKPPFTKTFRDCKCVSFVSSLGEVA